MVFLMLHGHGLSVVADFCLVGAQRGSESIVEIEGYDGFGQLIEVSAQDVRCIVDGVTGPVQAFAVFLGSVETSLKVFDALGRAAESEDAFNISCWGCASVHGMVISGKGATYLSLSGRHRILQPRWGHNHR